MKVIDFVRDRDKLAYFNRYRCGIFYYRISIMNNFTMDTCTYEFPIPVEDLGEATLNHEEKAILLMRYIRKAIDDKTMVKVHE